MTRARDDAESWFALAVGNSRLHWALFSGSTLQHTWDTSHLTEEAIASLIASQLDFSQCSELLQIKLPASIAPVHTADLWLASVVPPQTALWQTYSKTHVITLDDIPIAGLYSTFGIDRALALLGAIKTWGAPALVIDAGTALTFTAANHNQQLVGGAILPGLQLQMRSLSQNTAALPAVDTHGFAALPPRWATTTPEAIGSGVLYTTVAGIRDFVAAWLGDFPASAIAVTGGDARLVVSCLSQLVPELAAKLIVDPQLIFWGIRAIRQKTSTSIRSS